MSCADTTRFTIRVACLPAFPPSPAQVHGHSISRGGTHGRAPPESGGWKGKFASTSGSLAISVEKVHYRAVPSRHRANRTERLSMGLACAGKGTAVGARSRLATLEGGVEGNLSMNVCDGPPPSLIGMPCFRRRDCSSPGSHRGNGLPHRATPVAMVLHLSPCRRASSRRQCGGHMLSGRG